MTAGAGAPPPATAELDALIGRTLTDLGVEYRRWGVGDYSAALPGRQRLVTTCRLRLGDHSLAVEAFVLRRPAEQRERLLELLLHRNARLAPVAFAVDGSGDVFLVGRIPRSAVTGAEVDRLLGAVLTAVEDNIVELIRIGFAEAIRREWEWRLSRGESHAHLAAFAERAGWTAPDTATAGDAATAPDTAAVAEASTAAEAAPPARSGRVAPPDPDRRGAAG